MQLDPEILRHGDASTGQRLSTHVDLHDLGGSAELQSGLEALRVDITPKPRRASRSLFIGASSSGQALAAAALGKAAGMPVLRIDLSAVVSRYIGETEKNLDRLLGEAERADSILFFDEADALFGKRSEVHDAHDRYANLEVAYLLQKLEAFAGPVILAIGSSTPVDPAVLQRWRHVLRFSSPLQPPKPRPAP